MEITSTCRGRQVKAQLCGELDHHSAQQVREALDKLLQDPAVNELVLDMKDVGFMDSSGLGVVLGRYRILTQRGGRLLLSAVPVPIDRIFRMSGLYALVERI